MSWARTCGDLREEVGALQALLDAAGLDPEAETPFHGWRVRDSIGHMLFIDRLARLALTDPATFTEARDRFAAATAEAPGRSEDGFQRIAAYEDSQLRDLGWAQLRAQWNAGLDALCKAAEALEADARAPWFAAPMRAATLINARQMEVWAYGQDVFDLARVRRPEGDRLRNVAEFAIRTMGFSFAGRGRPAPSPKPYVELAAPSGARWTWNTADADSSVRGPAADFCLVTTQRRNVADTALIVEGEAAQTWMRIAQCIAGPPRDGPAPGARVVAYSSQPQEMAR